MTLRQFAPAFSLAVVAMLFLCDWLQTLRIARTPSRFRERWNPALRALIRRYGESGVDWWFSVVAVAALATVAILFPSRGYLMQGEPASAYWWFIGACGLIEGACVINNFREGIEP